MGLLSAGLTDIGRIRKTNQDAIYLNPEKHIFIVADGMGGHRGGDIASSIAVTEASRYLLEHYHEGPSEIHKAAVEQAHTAIRKRSEGEEKLSGMGTTIVSQLFRDSYLHVASVGDSRLYLIHKKKLFLLTCDHNLVQEKINLGFYTRDQAAKDIHKNVLVRAVGFEEDVNVDLYSYRVHRNDIFLSCSDGLHGQVSDPDILHVINSSLSRPEEATGELLEQTVHQLVDLANQNGGKDNVSVVGVIAQ